MASMDTDLVRGRVIGGQLFRRGWYRLDFWSVRHKIESNTVHDNMKKDTKAGRIMRNKTLDTILVRGTTNLKGKLHK